VLRFDGRACHNSFVGRVFGKPKRDLIRAAFEAVVRVDATRSGVDADAAVEYARRAVAACREGGRDWVEAATVLSAALHVRFRITGSLADLDEGIAVGHMAAGPGAARAANTLFTVANMWQERYLVTRGVADLDHAVDVSRRAVALVEPDDPEYDLVLHILAYSLYLRRHLVPDDDDLDEAISLFDQALRLPTDDHTAAARCFLLADCLETRYLRAPHPDDLDAAITFMRHALAWPDRPVAFRLAALLRMRIELTAQPADIEEAVEVGGQGITELPTGTDRGRAMSNLAIAHLARFEYTGDVDDLDHAVSFGRAAVSEIAAGSRFGATAMADLTLILRGRFERGHDWSDIVEAVDVGRAAVATADDDMFRMVCSVNLAGALQVRFMFRGSSEDLAEAVEVCRRGLELVPDGNPNQHILSIILADALARGYVRAEQSAPGTGSAADLDEAVTLCRAAVAATTPGDPRRAPYLVKLGFVLGLAATRHEETGEPADQALLDEAVDVAREAVAAVPPDHRRRGELLVDLAETLQRRFAETHADDDLREAADVVVRGLELIDKADPALADSLIIAGNVLRSLWVTTEDPQYAISAIQAGRWAAEIPTARVRMRIGAALDWARVAATCQTWDLAADGYATAVRLRPMMAWRGLDQADRSHLLDLVPELGADAAACAVAAGRADEAVELLELARGVLWAQLLDTRAGLSGLRAVAPELADRLAGVQSELDGGPGGPEAATAWDELLDEVRALPGFESFLAPPKENELRAAAKDGPVVIVNVSQWRCDALVLTEHGTTVVELPALTVEEAWQRTFGYLAAAREWESNSLFARLNYDAVLGEVLDWLWTAVAQPVLAALGDPPARRLWWCPCGPLALLPLHAAGAVPDLVVSSYTPTVRALLAARAADSSRDADGLLVVAVPEAPGQPALPAVEAEVAAVTAVVTTHTVLTGADATRSAVTSELDRRPWVHLACHGQQDLLTPSRAGVLVHDGMLTVADLSDARPGGQWAYLSACQTATGGLRNTDEVITLCSALVYAGWRHVLGTLWPVPDSVAARFAASVYDGATENGRLDADRAPAALHKAMLEIRAAHPDRPSHWAPFVHVGL
jgi:tetratricopeptide (TPR) repeat protein